MIDFQKSFVCEESVHSQTLNKNGKLLWGTSEKSISFEWDLDLGVSGKEEEDWKDKGVKKIVVRAYKIVQWNCQILTKKCDVFENCQILKSPIRKNIV